MSNKGLTFIIFILILLCVATFGAFYLKINPQMAISQKIFGTTTLNNPQVPSNTTANNAPFTDTKPTDTAPVVANNTPTTTAGTTTTVDVTPPPVTTAPVVTTPPPVNTAPTGPITTIVKKGSKGAQAKIVQQFLIDNKYLTGKADGVFGAMSETALKKFQAEYKINVDGVVDGKTRDMINELLAE